MKFKRPLIFVQAAACLMLLIACSNKVSPKNNPLAFREVLAGEEYELRFKQAVESLPQVEDLASSRMPLLGQIVIRILPGNQAEGLGIEVGDVITGIDQKRLWASWSSWDRLDEPQVMHLVTRHGESRSIEIQPGLVGVRYIPYRRPDLAYIRRADRLVHLDTLVLVGIATCRKDPDLAETAWYHAIRGGYVADDLSDACGAIISLYQSRPAVAHNFAKGLPAVTPEQPYLLYPRDRMQIAAASGHYQPLLDMPLAQQEAIDLNQHEIAGLIQVSQGIERPVDYPVHEATKMRRIDLMPDAALLWDKHIDGGYNEGGSAISGEPFDMSISQGSFRQCYFGFQRPAEDIDLSVRFTLSAEDQHTPYANVFEVALVDADFFEDNYIDLAGYTEYEITNLATMAGIGVAAGQDGESQVHLTFGNQSSHYWYEEPVIDVSRRDTYEVRLVRVGAYIEGQLDGVTVLRVPVVHSARSHGVLLKAVGVDVHVDEIRAVRLDSTPSE